MNLKYGFSIWFYWIGYAPRSHPVADVSGPLPKPLYPTPSPKEGISLTAPTPKPRKGPDGIPSLDDSRDRDYQRPRGMENGSGFVAPGAHVNGMTRPLVRTEPADHKPRKMRVVVAVGTPDDRVASRGSGLTHGPKEQVRESFTTGKTTRNGRGLTSGWGMMNGTGMVREAEFHHSVGRFNGSGLTKAIGLADDAGLTNGCGLTHGEGMTNGCGLVKEIDPSVPVPMPRPDVRRKGLRSIFGI